MPTDVIESVKCPACSADVANHSNFCGVCGVDMTPIHKAAEDAYINTLVGGRYRVKRKLGSGGMGEVYLAEHERLGQRVAIKFLLRRLTNDEQVVRRFFNEARSTCKVSHHGAVGLNDFGQTDDGVLYIIMEYIEGLPLNKLVEERGALDLGSAFHIIIQLCDTLHSAHDQGVIHRDLKPDNIMLTEGRGGRYATKILDFGIARLIDDGELNRLTQQGMVFGTPEFMSPEQCLGREVDGRSDQYALAIVLYYMLTGGYLPIQGGNRMELLNRQVSEPAVLPSKRAPEANVPPELEAIVMMALNKNPNKRYSSVADFADALEQVAVSLTNAGRMSGDSAPMVALMKHSEGATNTPPGQPQATDEQEGHPEQDLNETQIGPYSLGAFSDGEAGDPSASWTDGRKKKTKTPRGPDATGPEQIGDLGIDLSAETRDDFVPTSKGSSGGVAVKIVLGAVLLIVLGGILWLWLGPSLSGVAAPTDDAPDAGEAVVDVGAVEAVLDVGADVASGEDAAEDVVETNSNRSRRRRARARPRRRRAAARGSQGSNGGSNEPVIIKLEEPKTKPEDKGTTPPKTLGEDGGKEKPPVAEKKPPAEPRKDLGAVPPKKME